MVIGILCLEIYFSSSHSLKEKRKYLNSIRDRLKNKHNVAYAELNFQNKWQRTKIGVVTLNNQKRLIESIFNKIVEEAEENIDGEILDCQIVYFWFSKIANSINRPSKMNVTRRQKRVGSPVNIEVDMLARYIVNYLTHEKDKKENTSQNKDRILKEKLEKYGFI